MIRSRVSLISETKFHLEITQRRVIYLDESLHHTNDDDDAGKLKGSRQEQIEKGRAGDGSSEDSIGGINRSQETAWHLRHQVAPEKRRVDGALHCDAPLKFDLRST